MWRRLMGTAVLESGIQIQDGLHVYAHCLRGSPGGVALLAINNNRTAPSTIAIPTGGDRYTLAAGNLDSRQVQLNGKELALATNDELPTFSGVAMLPGNVTLAPATISFFALPRAGNNACP